MQQFEGDVTAIPTTGTDRQGYYFQAGNTATSDDWILTGCFIRADLYNKCDSNIDNSVISALLGGSS